MITAILFIAILSLLVLVHEWGHFYSARKLGMKVYEFGIGFPPRAFGIYKDPVTGKWVFVWKNKSTHKPINESTLINTVGGGEKEEEYPSVLWTVNWLPLGGFVKIKGENGEDESEPDSFGYHKTWKKVVVLVAGVSMNFILAAVLLGIGFMIGLPTDVTDGVDERAILVESPAVVVQQVEKGSPAEALGLLLGDKIVKINDQVIESSSQMITYVGEHAGEELFLEVNRAGEMLNLSVTPVSLEEGGAPKIGVHLADAALIRFPWYIAIRKGFVAAFYGTISIVVGFYLLLKGLILGQGLAFEVAGPVGIANIIGQSARLGLNYVLNVAAMISLSLAVINILPIPALDGGRLLFVLIEKFTGKKVPIKYEQVAHTVGFVLLMGLIVVVTWRDVVNLF